VTKTVHGLKVATVCLQAERLVGKCVYIARITPKGVTEKTFEHDLAVGEIQGSALDVFKSLVSDLYLPLLQEQQSWGKAPEAHTKEFLTGAQKFSGVLNEAVNCLKGGVVLDSPDPKYLETYEIKPAAFTQAASDDIVSQHMEKCLLGWCKQVEALLNESNAIKPGEEPGPDTELEFWRDRVAKINSITEQLKTKECKLVLGVTAAARSPNNKRWKALDQRITDAANEAKDNIKYLVTLEKSLEVLYTGEPKDILASLPSMITNVKTMYIISR
jgi:dynein heavy chain